MKVLQINTHYYNGGSTGRITFDLKKVMETNGIESYVAFGFGYNPKDDEKGTVYRIESDKELFISKLWTKATGHHGFNNSAHKNLRRVLIAISVFMMLYVVLMMRTVEAYYPYKFVREF